MTDTQKLKELAENPARAALGVADSNVDAIAKAICCRSGCDYERGITPECHHKSFHTEAVLARRLALEEAAKVAGALPDRITISTKDGRRDLTADELIVVRSVLQGRAAAIRQMAKEE